MSNKVKYIVCNVLDYAFAYGGTAGILICNFVSKANPVGFKIALSGIILIVALLFFMKASFEKHYRQVHDNLLQQLAEAQDTETKSKISQKLKEHKIKNDIYQRLMMLLPFIILYFVSWLGAVGMASLKSTTGLILICLGISSVFNVIKKPIKEQWDLEKITK